MIEPPFTAVSLLNQADEIAAVLAGETAGEPTVVCLTRQEVGLAIDGVAQLVRPDRREYAPLLHKLQSAYKPAVSSPGRSER